MKRPQLIVLVAGVVLGTASPATAAVAEATAFTLPESWIVAHAPSVGWLEYSLALGLLRLVVAILAPDKRCRSSPRAPRVSGVRRNSFVFRVYG